MEDKHVIVAGETGTGKSVYLSPGSRIWMPQRASHENVLQVVVAEGCTRIHHPTFHQLLSPELGPIY